MAIMKFGKTYTKSGDEIPVFMVQGRAIKDGIPPKNSRCPAKVSMICEHLKDGTAKFLTVNGWRGKATTISGIRKGDEILAIGIIQEREYNEKLFFEMDADFVSVCCGALKTTEFIAVDDDDAELPF